MRNIAPIVACDLDPRRRALALTMGADAVFDPREVSTYGAMAEIGGRTPNLIYECVGKQGIMNDIVTKAAEGATIVIGGFCLDPEQIYVPVAQMKSLTMKFARGDGPEEMRIALDAIASGKVDVRPLLGGTIGLSEVEGALLAMSDPSTPVRVVVDPSRL
jgi:threonine dehydrogenase-like Zn-dependent dehydrogenase